MAGNKVLEYLITAKDATASTIHSAIARIKGFAGGVFSNLMNIKAGWDMLAGTTRAAVNAMVSAARHLWSAIEEAMKFETAEKQFAILMGSMDKAKDHMKDLADFAALTPFEFNDIAKASSTLMVFSQNALGSKEDLEMFGDASMVAGEKLSETSFWIGRLYAALKGGQPFGEAAMRLQEMKILGSETRTQMENLTSEAGHSADAWNVFTSSLEKFKGAMIEGAKTGDGLTSTVKDNWTTVIRAVGNEFMGLAKVEMAYLITTLDKLRADGTIKKWAEEALAVVKPLAEGVMNLFDGETRKLTIDAAWDSLLATFAAGAAMIGEAIEFGIEKLAKNIPTVLGALWGGVKGVGKSAMDAGRYLGKTAGSTGATLGGEIAKGLGVDSDLVDQAVGEVKDEFASQYGFEKPEEKSDSMSDRMNSIIENLQKTLKSNAAEIAKAAEDRRARTGADETETIASIDAKIKSKIAEAKESQPKISAEDELRRADEKRMTEQAAQAKAERDKKNAEEQAKIQVESEKSDAENRLKNAEEIISENTSLAKAKFTLGDVEDRIAGDNRAKEEARLQKKYEDRLADVQKRVDSGADPNKLNKRDKAILDMDKERKAAQAKIDQAEQDKKNAQMLLQSTTEHQNELLEAIKKGLDRNLQFGG